MKKIISLSLAALLLVTLLLTATSCGMGMEGMTGYTRLRDHIKDKGGAESIIRFDAEAVNVTSVAATVTTDENGAEYVCIVAYSINKQSGEVYQIALNLTGNPEKAKLIYEVLDAKSDSVTKLASATSTILLAQYTGSEFITLDTVENIPPAKELTHRQNATVLLNALFKALDTYTVENLDMDVHELGFIALSNKYMAPKEVAEVDEDLGGAFSVARLTKAGLMLIQGMGMVFLVLAILWLVLIIFKKILYKDEKKTTKSKKNQPAEEETPALVATPVPAAPADDGQLIAVITAAVAAAIESDEDLSNQFAGGFRVVSFKKKNGKTSWNH